MPPFSESWVISCESTTILYTLFNIGESRKKWQEDLLIKRDTLIRETLFNVVFLVLKNRQISLELIGEDLCPVVIPFNFLARNELLKDMVSQRLSQELTLFSIIDSLNKTSRKLVYPEL